jgi:hypothetical protein
MACARSAGMSLPNQMTNTRSGNSRERTRPTCPVRRPAEQPNEANPRTPSMISSERHQLRSFEAIKVARKGLTKRSGLG